MIDHLIRNDFKAVDKRDPIASLYGYLSGGVAGVPIVLDNEKAYGVVNEKRFLKSRLSAAQRIESYVIGTRTLAPGASLEQALHVVAESKIPHVPVTDGPRLVGYVRAIDLLGEVDVEVPAERLMMEVPILSRDASVGEAMHHLHAVHAHVLPVVDANGRLSGVVTRGGLLPLATDARPDGRKAANGNLVDPRASSVEGYVDSDYTVVRADSTFDTVRRALLAHGFAIVVDESERPLGIITPEAAAAAVATL